MIYKKITAAVLCAQLLISCSENQPKKEPAESVQKMDTMTVTPEPSFTGVVFDSRKDLVCGMPVTAGVSDTAHYKGKVYGFCAAECKAEFIKDPVLYLTEGK
ncbi:MAG: YHS domain-containing protein [Ferruginibacter sp.]